MRAPGLWVEGLRARAGGHEILHGVDLHVGPGEVHVVMGPNGSGKSTLAHAIMGRPGTEVTGGRVMLDGQNLLELPTWQRSRAGVFLALQQPIEVPGVHLDAMLAEGLSDALAPDELRADDGGPRSQDADLSARLAEEAHRTGFHETLLHRPVNVDLSGGERKRNEIVQLGVLRPRYAVLDEIDSGLDVDALRAVAKRLEEATREWNLGILAVTHFRRLLLELRADRVHVLVGGRIVASGGADLADELERTGYRAYEGARSVPAR